MNQGVLERIVVREPWNFLDDLFLWLVVYRDSNLPANKLYPERDAGPHINIQVNGGANGLIHIRRGMQLRVHGFLQSRDYRKSLEEFISNARKSKNCANLAINIKTFHLKQNQARINQNVVETVTRRINVFDAATACIPHFFFYVIWLPTHFQLISATSRNSHCWEKNI